MVMYNWLKKLTKRWISYESGLQNGLANPPTLSGVHVDEEGSLAITAVWSAVNTISSLVAGLPLILHAKTATGKRPSPEHPLYQLLNTSPNPDLTKIQYWQTVMLHVLLWGNSYSEIERDEAGRPVNLWILPPHRIEVGRDESGVVYRYRPTSGSDTYLRAEDVFHIAGASLDGLSGMSPIEYARESIALTQACERFGAAFFGNSARPAGLLKTATALSDNARENLRRSWESLYSGTQNTGRTVILEEGLDFQAISIPGPTRQSPRELLAGG